MPPCHSCADALLTQACVRSEDNVELRTKIGAGLKSLEKEKEGASIKALFYMFAVTQEDFVHPMAVIELLWRSCCASESEKEEGSLTSRLKVRQWTQMLVDHSLLLGSSSAGVHLQRVPLAQVWPARRAKKRRPPTSRTSPW